MLRLVGARHDREEAQMLCAHLAVTIAISSVTSHLMTVAAVTA